MLNTGLEICSSTEKLYDGYLKFQFACRKLISTYVVYMW